MIRNNDRAVSPVVGVMLMLVVTIIIAAVVSGFAGNMAGEQKTAPQATIKAESAVNDPIEDTDMAGENYNPDYPVDFKASNGIMFEHTGGEAFLLDEINVQLLNQGIAMTVSPAEQVNFTHSYVCLPEDTTDGGYFAKVGCDVSDKVIKAGDKFMLYADACYKDDGADDDVDPPQKYISWELPSGRGYGPLGEIFEWKIIDRNSGSVIATGKLLLE